MFSLAVEANTRGKVSDHDSLHPSLIETLCTCVTHGALGRWEEVESKDHQNRGIEKLPARRSGSSFMSCGSGSDCRNASTDPRTWRCQYPSQRRWKAFWRTTESCKKKSSYFWCVVVVVFFFFFFIFFYFFVSSPQLCRLLALWRCCKVAERARDELEALAKKAANCKCKGEKLVVWHSLAL